MQHLCGYDRHAFDVHDTLFAELPAEKHCLILPDIDIDEVEPLGRVETIHHASALSFVGHGILPVKTNGGIMLPDFVKRTLGASRSRIFMGLHETDPCVVIFAEDAQGVRGADPRQAEGSASAPARSSNARRVYGFCEELWRPFNGVRLPNWARTLAGISACALFVGTGATFELWSLEEAIASGDASLVALARSAAQFRK